MPEPDGSVARAGEAALRIRIERGLAVEEAARAAALDVVSLEAFEDGEQPLELEELGRLAAVYGVTVSEFFGARWTPLQNYAGG